MTPMQVQRHSCQRGFTAISAVFILVVLTALGAFLLNVSTSQHLGSALDVQGVRVYEAARSGVEWGLFQQLRNGSCAAVTSYTPPAPTLSALTVTVRCTATPGTNGGPVTYTVESTACNQPAAGACPNASPGERYVERRLDVSF
ncbi:MAG: agglutinin biogenesis protein MshP [Curvibacter sp.]|jgi:MSHA biogenesis protein MshP|nr:agglutinin biogenesis protein MshP [Curvibacter sp.]